MGRGLCVFANADFVAVVCFDGVAFVQLEQFHVLHAFADLLLDFVAEFLVVLQEQAGVFTTLANAFVVVAEPVYEYARGAQR